MNKQTIPFIAPPHYGKTSAWVHALQQAMPNERVIAFDAMHAADRAACTVAIVANPDPSDLQQLPHLRWIQSVWAGVDRLIADLDNPALPIVRLVDPQLAETMAEAVLAWTLYLHRDMHNYARQQMHREWHARSYIRPERKRVGVIGLGALGSAAVQQLLAARFQVSGWSRVRKEIAHVKCYAGQAELVHMLTESDIVVCLLPLTSETRGLLDAGMLECMRPNAALINFARGPIIDEDALRMALDSGRISHAVLDVFATEPLPADQWQWGHPNVTVLPHCSAPTDMKTASSIVANNINRYRSTGCIPHSIDRLRGY